MYKIPTGKLYEMYYAMFHNAVDKGQEIEYMLGTEKDKRINNRDSYISDISDPEVIMEYCVYPLYINGDSEIKEKIENCLYKMAKSDNPLEVYQVIRFISAEDMLKKYYGEIPFEVDYSFIVPLINKNITHNMQEVMSLYKEGEFVKYKDTMWDMVQRIIKKSKTYKKFNGKD